MIVSHNNLRVMETVREINRLADLPARRPDQDERLCALVSTFISWGIPHHTDRHGQIEILAPGNVGE